MKQPDETFPDWSEPEPRARPRSTRPRDEAEHLSDDSVETAPVDLATELPGAVLMVPNHDWGFDLVTSDDHPGACTHFREAARDAILVKGTDAENVRSPRRFFFVGPTVDNGLKKRTAFELVPRPIRLHRLRLFLPGRQLGRLDETTLKDLRAELARLHPEE